MLKDGPLKKLELLVIFVSLKKKKTIGSTNFREEAEYGCQVEACLNKKKIFSSATIFTWWVTLLGKDRFMKVI